MVSRSCCSLVERAVTAGSPGLAPNPHPAPPSAWRRAGMLRENASEVALIGKSASRRDVRQRHVEVREKCARVLQPLRDQPLMGRVPGRLAEGMNEIAA